MPTREFDHIARLVADGYRAHQAGRIDIALQHYGEALKKQPNNFEAAYLSGVIYLQSGKLENACRLLAIAIAANPKNIDAASDYGTALAMSGDLAQAVSVFDLALR
jgi:Flp pilus assembly protein TadD